MIRRMKRVGWQGQAAVVVVLLAVAVGFCLLHFSHHGPTMGMCPDPCSVMVSAPVLGPLASLLLITFLVLESVPSLLAVSLRMPDPPPEARALA